MPYLLSGIINRQKGKEFICIFIANTSIAYMIAM